MDEPLALKAKKSELARINGKLGGRPKGAMSRAKITLRERVRMSQEEIVTRLFFLLHKGENHGVQLAAARELLDRGWGKPAQAVAVGIGGPDGGPVTILVDTGVPRRELEAPTIEQLPGSPRSDA